MVNQTAAYFEKVANALDLSIKISRPSRAVRNAYNATYGFIALCWEH